MSKVFVLLWMVFFHIVDDYYLQGILASMKQKSWWEKNAPEELYSKDYIVALLMHSMSWAFMIMLPIAYYYNFNISFIFVLWFVINTLLHAYIDNAKANKKSINLILDQSFHMVQILFTYLVCMVSIA